MRRKRHLFIELEGDGDRCNHCGIFLQDTQTDGEGCRARDINPACYLGMALTPAEQQAADAAGIDRPEAYSRKTAAVYASGSPLSFDELVQRREVIERAALNGAVPPPVMAPAGARRKRERARAPADKPRSATPSRRR
jgi:hypothetical protein